MFILKKLKSKSGAALIIVLMVLAVFSILIISLISTTMANASHAIRSEHELNASYIAQTGADTAAKYLIANRDTSEVESFYGSSSSANILSESLLNGEVDVVVEGVSGDDKTLIVNSNGTVNNQAKSVKLIMKKDTPAPWFGEYGISSKTTVTASGTSYEAFTNVAAGEGQAGDFVVEDGYEYLYGDSLPENFAESFPEVDEWRDNDGNIIPETDATVVEDGIILTGQTVEMIDYNDGSKVVIEDGIDLGGGSTLKFSTSESESNILYIKVKGDIETAGTSTFEFTGSGQVHLYVEGNVNFQGTFDNQLDGGADSLIMYVPQSTPERTIDLGGNPTYDAHIIAPDVYMEVSGNPTFTGMVIVDEFYGNGDFTFSQFPEFIDEIFEGTLGWPLQVIAYTK